MTAAGRRFDPAKVIPIVLVALVAGMVGYANWRDARATREAAAASLAVRSPRLFGTSRDRLSAGIKELQAQHAAKPADGHVAAQLADALMRQARVTGNAGLAIQAEQALSTVLRDEPMDYEAKRMLATVYLSQHRFREAIAEADRLRSAHPLEAWNYGVLGDAHMELGEYDEAFDAFQEMMQRRPNAAAYARAAYARELQGDLDGALELMTMAADSTTAHDPEGQAWHYAEIGNLQFQLGHLREARLQYERALHTFPEHPSALDGMARLHAAAGEYDRALAIYQSEFVKHQTPYLAARIGDLLMALNRPAEAERQYAVAEAGWKYDTPEPVLLARFLAERGRRIEEAIALAKQASAVRQDIFTYDALAWSLFKAGQLEQSRAAMKRALRTGTRDRTILYHAAAIERAAGDRAAALRLVTRALDGHSHFDVVSAPEASALLLSLTTPQTASR